MDYLFPNFLKDDVEFKRAREYWHLLCQEILTRDHQQENWEVWLEDQTPNRELFDNIAIYSLITQDRTKGAIINQQDLEYHIKWQVAAWTKVYERQDTEFWPSEYLVFNCNLTEENAQIFKKLFEAWIQPDCGRKEINALIAALIP